MLLCINNYHVTKWPISCLFNLLEKFVWFVNFVIMPSYQSCSLMVFLFPDTGELAWGYVFETTKSFGKWLWIKEYAKWCTCKCSYGNQNEQTWLFCILLLFITWEFLECYIVWKPSQAFITRSWVNLKRIFLPRKWCPLFLI